ncbi:hypothetical protein ASE08_22330 [Rhizobacter sp. Root16D2]|nr:hypothetical protein ASC88_17165 [Rhizobacter sp. Root29]KQW13855.1 hypothetical protein ASC98_17295 [Rhizobacter sp. Root1238]KRB20387.1 hypothetical protein ASE08_22330 [Rhizobacter sp. Root16D2]
MSVDDVKQEAWLVAADMEQKRGYPVDFDDPDDQQSVLKWLYCKLVKFAEKQMRHAIRIDKNWDQEDAEVAASALARLLTSPLDSDPLVRLQQAEDEIDYAQIVRHSYSEASAYVHLLIRFDWDVGALAADLRVSVQTLRKRLRVCGIKAKVQPSFFDGVAVIDPAFEPRRARRTSVRQVVEVVDHQRHWNFG